MGKLAETLLYLFEGCRFHRPNSCQRCTLAQTQYIRRFRGRSPLEILLRFSKPMFEEYGEPRFKAPTSLRRLVALGHLGRKTGRGFLTYE